MSRTLRVSLTLLVTGLCTAYVLWKIDIGRTIRKSSSFFPDLS